MSRPDASIDPFAMLAKDLGELERTAAAKPKWDPASLDDMISWCETELGLKLRTVPKVLAVFAEAIGAFQRRERLRLAVLGPRGGGKTKLTAAIELVAYRWYGYSWQNVGGSLAQSELCYAYVRGAHDASEDLRKFTISSMARDTRSKKGDSISVSAASQTSVRGPHPVGSSGGGGLTLDEAAIIPDEICDAAKGQLTTADPSALIQLSTMGENQAGRFWELVSGPKTKGYKLMTFDVFDVAKRCKYDCATTCPVKEHFAQDYFEGSGSTATLAHTAYCAGKAHNVDGWISVDEIAQQFRELDRGAFERELMGKAVGAVGAVYDPVLIDKAELHGKALSTDSEQHDARFQLMEKGAAIDWGFSSQCAVVYGLRLRETLLVYSWEFFTGETYSKIREHVLRRCFDEHIETIMADAANPSDNEELLNRGVEIAERRNIEWHPRVLPVAFNRWKEYSIGSVRRRLEQGQIKFASSWGGRPVERHRLAMKYLKALRTDDRGKIIKVDDHGPDALAMLALAFSQSFRSQGKMVP